MTSSVTSKSLSLEVVTTDARQRLDLAAERALSPFLLKQLINIICEYLLPFTALHARLKDGTLIASPLKVPEGALSSISVFSSGVFPYEKFFVIERDEHITFLVVNLLRGCDVLALTPCARSDQLPIPEIHRYPGYLGSALVTRHNETIYCCNKESESQWTLFTWTTDRKERKLYLERAQTVKSAYPGFCRFDSQTGNILVSVGERTKSRLGIIPPQNAAGATFFNTIYDILYAQTLPHTEGPLKYLLVGKHQVVIWSSEIVFNPLVCNSKGLFYCVKVWGSNLLDVYNLENNIKRISINDQGDCTWVNIPHDITISPTPHEIWDQPMRSNSIGLRSINDESTPIASFTYSTPFDHVALHASDETLLIVTTPKHSNSEELFYVDLTKLDIQP